MSSLNREVEIVQNPALGAMLLWRFTTGYSTGSRTVEATPLPLLFVVLPICFHRDTAQLVQGTQKASGLRAFAGKFSDSHNLKSDLLLAIQRRSLRMRTLTLSALRIAVGSKLILLEPKGAIVIAGSRTAPVAGMSDSIKRMLKLAEKLGYWCGSLTLHEVSVILKLRF